MHVDVTRDQKQPIEVDHPRPLDDREVSGGSHALNYTIPDEHGAVRACRATSSVDQGRVGEQNRRLT